MKNNLSNTNTNYNVGVYCRLSKEDLKGSAGEYSSSIENQESVIKEYVEKQGWTIYNTYVDDDVTGTTFDRPAFQTMIQDIKDSKINCVITKDLSRFGRNYAEAANYRELFNDYNVRYIAIHDNHDSFVDGDNISTPIKELINEYYAADISKKVRNSKKLMARQGKFANSRAPYGYIKSPNNKHVLEIDTDVAHNVIRIFELFISGKPARNIAEIFNDEGIPSINAYYYSKLNKPNPYTGNHNKWSGQTVISILKNHCYYGAVASGKREVKSLKNKKIISKDISEWIIVENTHEPLVSKEVWLEAQEVCKRNKKDTIRRNSKGEVTIFAGVIKCGCCGGNLVHNTKKLKSGVSEFFRCSTYAQKGKSACRVNHISYDVVYQAVLNSIRESALLAEEDEKALISAVLESNFNNKNRDLVQHKQELLKSTNRISEIDKLITNLYEDKVAGGVTIERFNKMANEFDLEQQELIAKVEVLKQQLEGYTQSADEVAIWTNKIKECLNIKELTRALVFELISKIEVTETLDADNNKNYDISIFYKFKQPRV